MEIVSTYSIKIKGYNDVFKPTVHLYRQAVDWYIEVVLKEWIDVAAIAGSKARMNYVQRITTSTKDHPSPKYNFTTAFYKFPVYLRRAAIMEAIGKVSSYKENCVNWKTDSQGKPPGMPKAGNVYPALYKDNMFVRAGTYEAKVKVWIRNTWDWLTVRLKKSDVDYILHHCTTATECVPTLQKRGKEWFLDFPFKQTAKLNNTPIKEQTAVAVDLGINSACTCSAVKADGTVIGKKFLKLPVENDSLNHRLNKVKQAQQRGNRGMPKLWASVNGMNDRIAVLTAQFIVNVAQEYNADVIVFEHLDTQGRKRGSKKQRLHFWKANRVQDLVMHKAHKLGIRVSHVCAWNTSKLAFDGSGTVKRGRDVCENASYSVCQFQNGKMYNCDLNASYNIAARYFVREILKSLSETARLATLAKVPECAKRTTCTLSSLFRLNAVLYA